MTKERARMVGNLTKKKKMSNAQGSAWGGGGGAWAPLDLTNTLYSEINYFDIQLLMLPFLSRLTSCKINIC